jgi:ATP-dependent DNA helicase HFM1/MER3
MGRAGRPGFDTSGTAVIMRDNASKSKYKKLSGGMELIESHLLSTLMDVVNMEVSQRVITSVEVARDWIKSTFFFRRAIENLSQYGLPASESDIEAYVEKQCLESLQ